MVLSSGVTSMVLLAATGPLAERLSDTEGAILIALVVVMRVWRFQTGEVSLSLQERVWSSKPDSEGGKETFSKRQCVREGLMGKRSHLRARNGLFL